MPVTEQAGTLPHCSGGTGETRQKKSKEEGKARLENKVRWPSAVIHNSNKQRAV